MNSDEANRIIAEYMGNELGGYYVCNTEDCDEIKTYGDSLDALVPVWSQLATVDGFRFSNRLTIFKDKSVSDVSTSRGICCLEEGKTIQEAAVIATAKAIKELNNEY